MSNGNRRNEDEIDNDSDLNSNSISSNSVISGEIECEINCSLPSNTVAKDQKKDTDVKEFPQRIRLLQRKNEDEYIECVPVPELPIIPKEDKTICQENVNRFTKGNAQELLTSFTHPDESVSYMKTKSSESYETTDNTEFEKDVTILTERMKNLHISDTNFNKTNRKLSEDNQVLTPKFCHGGFLISKSESVSKYKDFASHGERQNDFGEGNSAAKNVLTSLKNSASVKYVEPDSKEHSDEHKSSIETNFNVSKHGSIQDCNKTATTESIDELRSPEHIAHLTTESYNIFSNETVTKSLLKPLNNKRNKINSNMAPILEMTESEEDHNLANSSNNKDRSTSSPSIRKKCGVCKVRLGLCAIRCRCGHWYCAKHRYDQEHNCSFDYKAMGAEEIRLKNPQVIAEKIRKL